MYLRYSASTGLVKWRWKGTEHMVSMDNRELLTMAGTDSKASSVLYFPNALQGAVPWGGHGIL